MWNSDFDDDLKDNAILEQKSYRSYSPLEMQDTSRLNPSDLAQLILPLK
jgi:hypothetical protein